MNELLTLIMPPASRTGETRQQEGRRSGLPIGRASVSYRFGLGFEVDVPVPVEVPVEVPEPLPLVETPAAVLL